jgi:uncharacterized protein
VNELRGQLEAALKSALRARDRIAAGALRSTLGAIDNAGAVEGPDRYRPLLGAGAGEAVRRELSIEELRGIVRAEVADRTSAADEYERLGRPAEADRLRAEAAVLEHFTRP